MTLSPTEMANIVTSHHIHSRELKTAFQFVSLEVQLLLVLRHLLVLVHLLLNAF